MNKIGGVFLNAEETNNDVHRVDVYNGIKFINIYSKDINKNETQRLKKEIFDIAKKYS